VKARKHQMQFLMKKTNVPISKINTAKKAKSPPALKSEMTRPPVSEAAYKKLLEELGAYQIELEMQNEELRVSKAKLQADANQYSKLYNFAPSGYFTLSEEGDIIDVNICGARMLRKTQQKLKRNRFALYVSPDKRAIFHSFLESISSSRKSESCEIILLDNDSQPIHILLAGTLAETGNQYLLNAIDITEQKQTEHTIRQLSQAVEQSPVSIVITDTRGTIQYANQKYMDLTGYTLDELTGKTPAILKSGHSSATTYEELWQTLLNGGIWHGEFLNKKKNGTLFWELAAISPIKNEEGIVTHFLEIKEDITEKKEADEILKQYASELKNSNTELENFAFLASHDLQEPLRMINSFLNLLEKKIAVHLDDTTKQYIHYVKDGTARMKTLINDLLMYSRVGSNTDNYLVTNLNEVLQYITQQLLKTEINTKKAQIKLNALPTIHANKTLITELFLNLVTNALKYNTHKKPVVQVGYEENENDYIFFVKDNGIGISPEYFEKIFLMFQRLHSKEEYNGTGIGLALCKKVVEMHHGKIRVESAPGTGSTFYCTFPKQYIKNIEPVSLL
jgi:PAS domain S-box-containing protein